MDDRSKSLKDVETEELGGRSLPSADVFNAPVVNGRPVTFGDMTGSRPRPPAAVAVAAFTAPSAPGAANQDLREDILRIFGKGKGGEDLLQHLTSANLIIYLKGGMYKRYQRDCIGKGLFPVSEAEFVANIRDFIDANKDRPKGGRKNKRKSMKRKSMKRKSMKRMNKRKNERRFLDGM